MDARRVTVEACGVCGCPIRQHDTHGRPQSRDLGRREALLIEAGFSRGGWGRRDIGDGVRIKFSEEVCGECFDEAQALLKPVREFLRGGARREEHNLSAVRDNITQPERRAGAFLRSVSSLLRLPAN